MARGVPGGKSSAMGDLPFAVAAEVTAALTAFSTAGGGGGTGGCSAVSLCLVDEVVTLLKRASFSPEQVAAARGRSSSGGGGCESSLLSSGLFPDGFDQQAAFLLLRLPKAAETRRVGVGVGDEDVVFVYACPEGVPIKMKMVHSTAKSSVLALASGVHVS